ncbi:MAG: hypothetical protein M1832_006116 [Thelocarpon impressellum]|nr:MAG: hypothetical protein M1832_006116 [Thelocarpon impressellum]
MVERSTSTRSQYAPPTVETVLEFSDDDEPRPFPSRRSTISTSTSTSLKKVARRRHRASGVSISSSSSSAEKERRRSSRRSRSRPDLTASPTSASKGVVVDTDIATQTPDQKLAILELEVGKHYPQLGKIVGVEGGEVGKGPRRSASTGSLKSLTSSADASEPCKDTAVADNKLAEASDFGNSPYRPGSKMSASVLSTLTAFSGMTNASGGSSGSNSTITQESISKSRSSGRKRSKSRTRTPKSSRENDDTPKAERKATVSDAKPMADAKPSVFAYMEEGSATLDPVVEWKTVSGPTSAPRQSKPARGPPLQTVVNGTFADDKDGHPRSSSLHSDSGISMRDDSPERTAKEARTAPKGKSSAREVFEPIFARQRERAASGFSAASRSRHVLGGTPSPHGGRDSSAEPDTSRRSSLHHPNAWNQSPSAAYAMPDARLPPSPPHLEPFPSHNQDVVMPGPPSTLPRHGTPVHMSSMPAAQRHSASRSSSAERTPGLSGYGLLASNLSSLEQNGSTLFPLYRRFEALNNRLFLHLQDEIAELEEELRLVDEADAHARSIIVGGGSNKPRPASRRVDSRSGKELEWRRLDVLGRIFTKVGHYISPYADQALSSYSTLIKSLEPADKHDVDAYRAWMAEHAPIAEPETHFLRRDADLLCVKQTRSVGVSGLSCTHLSRLGSESYGTPALRLLLSVLAGAVILPILTFGLVPGLLARLVIVMIIAGASVAILALSSRASGVSWPMLEGEGRWELGVAA